MLEKIGCSGICGNRLQQFRRKVGDVCEPDPGLPHCLKGLYRVRIGFQMGKSVEERFANVRLQFDLRRLEYKFESVF
jgi:hypothetical protein